MKNFFNQSFIILLTNKKGETKHVNFRQLTTKIQKITVI